jgi:hypothetical protein
MENPFTDDHEILDLVRRFESCELNPADFRHYQHLTVALYYVQNFPDDVASEKMRDGIKKLAAAYGKDGYHETITLFWLVVVRRFAAANSKDSITELANRLVAAHDDKSLIKTYYSEGLITSVDAKTSWVEPDLKPF